MPRCGQKNLNGLYQPSNVQDAFLRTITITGDEPIALDDVSASQPQSLLD